MISKKTRIALIGAGKIAYSLAASLKNAGYNINIIISEHLNSAKDLAEKYSVKRYSINLNELDPKINVFFLSVPDNQIKVTADKLAGLNLSFHDSIFIHLSGAESISNLIPLKAKGALTASFHIMQTFPSKKIVNIENCYAAIETEDEYAEGFLYKTALDLNLKPFKLKSENKSLYHLAGVFASNFLVGNIFNSEKVFNINKKDNNYRNFNFLIPIIKSTLNNVKKFGSYAALSGPVERGDITTIKKHIFSLKKLKEESKEFNELYISYVIQSLNLLNLVRIKNKTLSKKHLELRKLLIDELKALNDIS